MNKTSKVELKNQACGRTVVGIIDGLPCKDFPDHLEVVKSLEDQAAIRELEAIRELIGTLPDTGRKQSLIDIMERIKNELFPG